jgi:hypothetical protein
MEFFGDLVQIHARSSYTRGEQQEISTVRLSRRVRRLRKRQRRVPSTRTLRAFAASFKLLSGFALMAPGCWTRVEFRLHGLVLNPRVFLIEFIGQALGLIQFKQLVTSPATPIH